MSKNGYLMGAMLALMVALSVTAYEVVQLKNRVALIERALLAIPKE